MELHVELTNVIKSSESIDVKFVHFLAFKNSLSMLLSCKNDLDILKQGQLQSCSCP